MIVVPDTLRRAPGARSRRPPKRSGAQVVAITGSAGKTTTKEVTADLLAAKYDVYSQSRQSEQPHRPAAVAGRAAPRSRRRRRRARHESRRARFARSCRLPSPTCACGRTSATRIIGYFGSRDAIARAKAEILEASAPATTRRGQRRRSARDAATHLGSFSGRRRARSASAPARRARGPTSSIAASTARRPTVDTRAGTLRADRRRCPAGPSCSNVLAAVAVALEFGVPPATPSKRARRCAAAGRPPRCVIDAGQRRAARSTIRTTPVPPRCSAMLAALAATPTSRAGAIAVLGEMLELGAVGAVAARDVRPRRGGRRRRRAGRRLAATAADGLADGAIAGGHVGDARASVRGQRDGGSARRRARRRRRLVLVKGSRGTRTDIVADRLREVALMLLPPPLSASGRRSPGLGVSGTSRSARPRRASRRSALEPGSLGPGSSRRLRAFQSRPGDSSGRPGQPQAEGRHADDGRPADSGGGVRADAALGGSDEPVHLDRRARRRRPSAPSDSSTTI